MAKNAKISKGQKRLLINIITLIIVIVIYGILSLIINFGVIDRYSLNIINKSLIGVIMAVSLNLVVGLMGQLVLGHAGFMAIGAYTSAILSDIFINRAGMSVTASILFSLFISGLFAAIFGIIIGIPALRLRGDYLAIITLGFGEIIRVIANSISIKGNTNGNITGVAKFQNDFSIFSLLFFVAVATIFICYTYGTSRHGRAVLSIRDDEIAAESIGIRITYYKLLTFVIAAAFAGIAGGLYAHLIGAISPSEFGFNKSIEYLVMVVLGGMGSITGAIISAFALTSLPEFLRGFSNYRMLIYSTLLVCVMMFRPIGLMGRKEFSLSKIIDNFSENSSGKDINKERRRG